MSFEIKSFVYLLLLSASGG